jgi:hypothetical protein
MMDRDAEIHRLQDAVMLAQQLGRAYRGDWLDFDGRTLRDQLNDLSDVVSGGITVARYRASNSLCPYGHGHWDEYCRDDCAEKTPDA